MIHCANSSDISSSAGYSQTAEYINGRITQIIERPLDTVTFGYSRNHMFNQLYDIFDQCSSEGWDGYQAVPVARDTFDYASFILACLSPNIPFPEIGADPDGHLNFEWYKDPRHLVSVSISPEGKLYYAALIGEKKVHGTEHFSGEISKRIRDIIHEVVPE